MLNLLKVVVITNLLAALIVFILSKYIAFFNSTSLMDFLFFIVIIIWGIARLTWDGSSQSRNWAQDPASKKTMKMVSNHDFESDYHEQKRLNYQFGLVMFVSGIPAFLGSILLLVTS
ncbi:MULTISPECIES: hypothetical protein [Aliivibrio]|uniref:DUF3899 domain-containing protein n=1 Tax=Aliivibrio finisterrensis TaxID=511998 RepID=A0A4Q5KKL3_9GAMM|nr:MULTISPECIES: hypothetical protein [Aliivibrio]MDD9180779.1 hypothetical protein [Aliivibrio sp. A6]RYU46778.1 hypothetical protein ERW57_19090 [Aliivibrio finisterrensis]RYU47096.1 hypothetical protein ERW56_19380 [Aliivibrio finisterrensis]RYU51609.1 hypothetical protein ERW50_19465 [Aliivibrio finisterrensis]RYU58336.1 hypothetical protein ERW53_20500 [Aliivibrio finisterrensis]